MHGWHVYSKRQPAHWYDHNGVSWCNKWTGSGTTSVVPELSCEDCKDPFYRLKFRLKRLKQKAKYLLTKENRS